MVYRPHRNSLHSQNPLFQSCLIAYLNRQSRPVIYFQHLWSLIFIQHYIHSHKSQLRYRFLTTHCRLQNFFPHRNFDTVYLNFLFLFKVINPFYLFSLTHNRKSSNSRRHIYSHSYSSLLQICLPSAFLCRHSQHRHHRYVVIHNYPNIRRSRFS